MDHDRHLPVPVRPWEEVQFESRPWRHRWNRGRYVVSFTTELPYRIAIEAEWIAQVGQPSELGDAVTEPAVGLTLWPTTHPPEVPQHLSVLPDWDEVQRQHHLAARPRETTFAETVHRPGPEFQPTEEILSRTFDQGLAALNRLVVEYAIATSDPYCWDVAKEMLPANCLVTFKDLATPFYAHTFMRLHRADAPVKNALSPETLAGIADRARQAPDPDGLAVYHESRTRAGHAIESGRYLEAVAACAIAVEALLFWVLRKRARETSWSSEHIDELFRDRGIRWIVKSQFHPWLGGSWDPSKRTTPCGQWAEDVNEMRNRCLHQGYRPNHREATAAYEAGRSFSQFILDRIGASGRQNWLPLSRDLQRPYAGAYIWETGGLDTR